jgi:uncharacterized phage-associated protein
MGVTMYNPIHVSNNFLVRSFEQGVYITPMKLQKMLYFLYRDYLKETDIPLFAERFSAWKYGPVLESVYYTFKDYGNQGITQYGGYPGPVYSAKEDNNGQLRALLNDLWEICKPYNGIYLSRLTHRPECAWYKAWTNGQMFLLDEDIKTDTVQVQ